MRKVMAVLSDERERVSELMPRRLKSQQLTPIGEGGGEFLQTSHPPLPGHGSFTPSEGQVRIFRPVVFVAASDLPGHQGPEPVPPEAHRFMAHIGAALGAQILHIAQPQRKRTYIITARRMIPGDALK